MPAGFTSLTGGTAERVDALERDVAALRAAVRRRTWALAASGLLSLFALAHALECGRLVSRLGSDVVRIEASAPAARAPGPALPRAPGPGPPPVPAPEGPEAAAEDTRRVLPALRARNLAVVASAPARDGSGRVFLCRHPAGGGDAGPDYALFLPRGGAPQLFWGGRYYWEVLPPGALAEHFARERGNGTRSFTALETRAGPGGSLDAVLLCTQDGRRWGLTVRDYRDRSLEPLADAP